MSLLGSWLWGTSQLDDAIEKATSELLPIGSEEIALNLEICDQIRSKSVSAKDAMRALKRRLNHSNPNVQLLALNLTDTCVKNGGDLFLSEIASREFMDNLVSILKIQNLNHEVMNTILRHIQNWTIAFEGKASLSYVGQVYRNLQQERYNFPPRDPSVSSSAMVDTQTAPEWIDSDVCLRCRTPFTFTNRKHHCRNCGQVFDQQCSSKSMPLPHFGIAQEVRVCDGCHSKLTKKAFKIDRSHKHPDSRTPRSQNAQDFVDEDLQRAIQLSLQEASASGRPGYVSAEPPPSQWHYSEPPIVEHSSYTASADDNDADLKAAIEASLREAKAPKPSAPAPNLENQTYSYGSVSTPTPTHPPLPKLPNYELEPLESDAILTFSQTVDQLQAQGGRDISRYPGVNELYDKANSVRPKLALCLDDAGRKEQMLGDMHEKLSQAVKLYDQLLTEQVVHPRWRSPQPANAAHVHNPSLNGTTGAPQPQWTGNTQGIVTSHASTDAPYLNRPNSEPYPQPARTDTAQSMWYPTQQPPQHSLDAPTDIPQRAPQPQQYSGQTPYQYNPPGPAPSQPPSIQAPMQLSSAPTSVKSPPVAVLPYDPAATPTPRFSPELTRSNTISSTYAPTSTSVPLSRSNTVSHTAGRIHHQPAQQHYRHQSVPQQIYAASTPAPPASMVPTLPHFPSAPTTLPQTLPGYGSPISTSVMSGEERKEALLIEL